MKLNLRSLLCVGKILKRDFHPKLKIFIPKVQIEKVLKKLNMSRDSDRIDLEFDAQNNISESVYAHKSLIKNVLINMVQSALREACCDSRI